jgi:hypothetical protein
MSGRARSVRATSWASPLQEPPRRPPPPEGLCCGRSPHVGTRRSGSPWRAEGGPEPGWHQRCGSTSSVAPRHRAPAEHATTSPPDLLLLAEAEERHAAHWAERAPGRVDHPVARIRACSRLADCSAPRRCFRIVLLPRRPTPTSTAPAAPAAMAGAGAMHGSTSPPVGTRPAGPQRAGGRHRAGIGGAPGWGLGERWPAPESLSWVPPAARSTTRSAACAWPLPPARSMASGVGLGPSMEL